MSGTRRRGVRQYNMRVVVLETTKGQTRMLHWDVAAAQNYRSISPVAVPERVPLPAMLFNPRGGRTPAAAALSLYRDRSRATITAALCETAFAFLQAHDAHHQALQAVLAKVFWKHGLPPCLGQWLCGFACRAELPLVVLAVPEPVLDARCVVQAVRDHGHATRVAVTGYNFATTRVTDELASRMAVAHRAN